MEEGKQGVRLDQNASQRTNAHPVEGDTVRNKEDTDHSQLISLRYMV
jgi:hypothetical protein